MSAPNFRAVLDDLQDLQAERRDMLADAQARLDAAKRRLIAADLDVDMRVWTPCEREEYSAACAEYDEAFSNLKRAEALQ